MLSQKKGLSLDLLKEIKTYCVKIAPCIQYYKKQIEYYNQTPTDIKTNEIALMLPTFYKNKRQKRGIITSLITDFIELAYEGNLKCPTQQKTKGFTKVSQCHER